MTNRMLYEEFHNFYAKANPEMLKKKAHDDVNIKWNSMKEGKVLDMNKYKETITHLKAKLAKRKSTMFDFVINPPKKAIKHDTPQASSSVITGIDSQNDSPVTLEEDPLKQVILSK